MKLILPLLAITLASLPAFASSTCVPTDARAPRIELRVNGSEATLVADGAARTVTLTERADATVTRYEADGIALTASEAGLRAELLTAASGRRLVDLELTCSEDSRVAPATMADMIQFISYAPDARNERPSRNFRKTPRCPTSPGSTVCLPHGFGAPRSR